MTVAVARQAPAAATSRSKRLLDVVASLVALGVLAPVMIAVALAILVSMGRPVLYRQRRPGLRGQPFTMCKFRTMNSARSDDGRLLPDEQRVTRVGRFLRGTSLDEIPELVNVLRGEMSLVGPRPLVMAYLSRYNAEQARRHDVRPGITGLAQVNGRNALEWPSRFQLDVEYVDCWSLALDIRILATTVAKLIRRDDVTADGMLLSSTFMGDGRPCATGLDWDPEHDVADLDLYLGHNELVIDLRETAGPAERHALAAPSDP